MSCMVILFIIFFLITARKTNQAYVKSLMLANTAILGEERA